MTLKQMSNSQYHICSGSNVTAAKGHITLPYYQIVFVIRLSIQIYIHVIIKYFACFSSCHILSAIASLQNSSWLWFRVFSTCWNRLGAFRPLFTFLSRLNSNILFWLLFGALIILWYKFLLQIRHETTKFFSFCYFMYVFVG